jgi:hypothetical protein
MATEGLSFKEKIRTISFGQARYRRPKVTTDVHDHHTVDVTEYWHDRQDVTVKPDTIRYGLKREPE